MTEYVQNQKVCTPYVKNPYICPMCPKSNVIVPQGQVIVPQVPAQPLQIITNLPENPSPNVSYNQVTPYINTGATVFNPSIQTKSGQTIANATAISTPILKDEAQLVYQGPIKNVNPQITPVEQTDAQIEKDFQTYFKTKAEENGELKSALDKTVNKNDRKKLPAIAKILGGIIVIGGIYKYRAKIPLLKKLFK